MKKEEDQLLRLDSLSYAHRLFGLPQPRHPLISVINGAHTPIPEQKLPGQHVLAYYKISYKPKLAGRLKYGQGYYDFDEGGLLFAAPGQIIGGNGQDGTVCSQYTLLIHPDLFLGYPLAKKIKQYGFFSYSTHETLHLSEEEKNTILAIFSFLETELNGRIDEFSQDVMISQIDLLLSYATRFHRRQFLTRKAASTGILQQLEETLDAYFNDDISLNKGIPTVAWLAEQLNLSPNYLSDMLRTLTGQSAQQHIHDRLIGKAKEKLSTTSLSVAEIAYELGFEHPQSFSKLFKARTNFSPLEFRKSFSGN
ncbi:helix-turn-helix domain-containing protein [Flavihumibacter petaseus]|uniref:Putative AraC family transcriptional regulator n=1 Tax=Flavihumibacter petaseus NBRC 106054 TaxID=1220578 RepID=A0A0E9N6H3_9BACT|nr:helix-turn-helix transcriptional regulator [Flavihumibacter petaseus]GAO45414.1 putative AraC family transcriptional regulator [Flavihumibacter petaseus NBRC 106054]